jgi:hypothetical protein
MPEPGRRLAQAAGWSLPDSDGSGLIQVHVCEPSIIKPDQ